MLYGDYNFDISRNLLLLLECGMVTSKWWKNQKTTSSEVNISHGLWFFFKKGVKETITRWFFHEIQPTKSQKKNGPFFLCEPRLRTSNQVPNMGSAGKNHMKNDNWQGIDPLKGMMIQLDGKKRVFETLKADFVGSTLVYAWNIYVIITRYHRLKIVYWVESHNWK